MADETETDTTDNVTEIAAASNGDSALDELPEDEWRPIDKARSIIVIIDGTTHVLRAPKIGERKAIVTALTKIGNDGDERREQEFERLRAENPDESEKTLRLAARGQVDQSDDVIGWWLDVFERLDISGHPMPEPDALPSWILDESLIAEAQQHWRAAPRRRGD